MMIRFLPAISDDVGTLTDTAKRAFEHDVHYGAPRPMGPPGYDSEEFHHEVFQWGRMFKITTEGEIIGGIIVRVVEPGDYELSSIWLVPEWQNRGVGRQAMQWLEETFPAAHRWSLETPVWNKRTQHFYESWGYTRVGNDPYWLVQYEKRM